MKKMKYVLLTILFVFLAPQLVMAETKDKVSVYIFKSSTCPHCEQAMNFFEELSEDSEYGSYFTLVPFETNGSTDEIKANVSLAQKVVKYFGSEFDGVPLIVIGDKKFEGYASSYDEQIKEKIKVCYDGGCTNVVAGVQDGSLVTSSRFDTIFIILILVVIVGGVGYFIYIARQNPVDEESNDKVSSKEEKVVEMNDKKEKDEDVKESSIPSKNKNNQSKKKNGNTKTK